ncbi:hypothetical protein PUN28_008245 [Cardiocondyla obscurior]|uniref:Uncharacterized protein n=1 Tax=Cardiocondyla obscurior TaxID=286306 RepID=A0AAW2FXA1_9HYME
MQKRSCTRDTAAFLILLIRYFIRRRHSYVELSRAISQAIQLPFVYLSIDWRKCFSNNLLQFYENVKAFHLAGIKLCENYHQQFLVLLELSGP